MRNQLLLLLTIGVLCSGCQIVVSPAYRPTGALRYRDLQKYPVSVEVKEGRSGTERSFFHHGSLKYWDFNSAQYADHQYVRLAQSSCEVVKDALIEAMQEYGYVIRKDAQVQFQVTLYKFLFVIDTWHNCRQGICYNYADMELEVEVKTDERTLTKKRIQKRIDKEFDAFNQVQDAGPLLSSCLIETIEELVMDQEILAAVKKGYPGEFAFVTAPSTEGERQTQNESEQEHSKPAIRGTGFVISEAGYVATDFHVVEGLHSVYVVFPATNQRFRARVELKDISNDIAILRIEESKDNPLPSIQIPYSIGSTSQTKLGEEVFTLGYPLGELLGDRPKLSKGNISSLEGIGGTANLFQISNPIQPGNSGGPLFAKDGRLIGIVLASLNAKLLFEKADIIPQNVNFAIKSDYLINLIQMLPEKAQILGRTNTLKDRDFTDQISLVFPIVVQICSAK